MAKARKARPDSRGGRRKRRVVEEIPLTVTTAGARRLALKFDKLVSTGSLKSRSLAALQSDLIGSTIRDGKIKGGKQLIDLYPSHFRWPDSLYVPRDHGIVGPLKPPASRLYSDDWIGTDGVAKADKNTGGLFAYAGARTTEGPESANAAVGIRYSPLNSLSQVRYEPEVDCAITYRMFVDYWPDQVAGGLRVRASLIMAAWEVSPVLSGSFELLRWREVTVFDTYRQDASSNIWPNVPHTIQRNFSNSALATIFPLQNGRTYLLGTVARVQVEHNVTTIYGDALPHDPNKFRLYSQMVCSVPYMSVSVQQVLIP